MDEENVVNPELNEDDELDNKVVLTDEEGNDAEFEFLDVIRVDEKDYVILLPVETRDEGEVVIFRIEGEGDDETYIGVDNADEAEKVFNAFKESAKDTFNFE